LNNFDIANRRRTIVGLLRQKEEWIDKEKMLLNQLWAALEEKLENKSLLHESRTALDKFKGKNLLPCRNIAIHVFHD